MTTSNIDISILKNSQSSKVNAILEIRPLAPLSMVSEMPGSFYKTLQYPSKKMLCGLFESILGWHFDNKVRTEIFNNMAKLRKKHKQVIKRDQFVQGSTYLPLLMEYFDVVGKASLKDFKSVFNYSDLWNRGYRRADSNKHLNGCRNIDISLVAEKVNLYGEWASLSSKEAEANKDKWFKKNIGKIPCFYTSPTNREYVALDAIVSIPLCIDSRLFAMLCSRVMESNLGYLGNSEGWVNIKIEKQ